MRLVLHITIVASSLSHTFTIMAIENYDRKSKEMKLYDFDN